MKEQVTFAAFCSDVKEIMEKTAEDKHYNDDGVDGKNELDVMMEKHFEGHACGEAAYKLVRYRAKHQSADLIKAVAWIFLEWRRNQRRLLNSKRD